MENWRDVVYKARMAYAYRDMYAYLYGAKGEIFSDDLLKRLMSYYPEHYSMYTEKEITEIARNSKGRVCYDCSGFVNWMCTKEEAYSTLSYEQAARVYQANDLANLPHAGCLYYKGANGERHIGIDIGRGMYADMGLESTDWAVLHGMDSVRIFKYGQSGSISWTYGFENSNVDYSYADLW